jgi:hypothetical protein
MRQSDRLGSALILGALAVACSGASPDSGLFGADDGSDASADVSFEPATPSESGAPDAMLAAEAGTVSHVDAGPADGAPADAQADAEPGVRCFGEASKYCPLPEVCCVTGVETAGTCKDEKTCAKGGGVAFPCADARDCTGVKPGDVCCATWDDTSAEYTSVKCHASCPKNATERQLCDPTVKPDECAHVGLTCKKPASGTGYAYCQ